jgi:hypothetical protein
MYALNRRLKMYKFFNINHLIVLVCLSLIFSGCTYAPYRYNFSLVEPESETFKFEDNNVQFRFLPSPEKIWVAIRNKTDKEMNLVRDKAEFIDHQGKSYTVLYGYSGRNFEDMIRLFASNNRYISPMRIDPDSEITGNFWINTYLDIVTMQDWSRVKSVDIDYSLRPFFPRNRNDGKGEELEGSTFDLILPIDFDGHISNYTFTFKINDVIE